MIRHFNLLRSPGSCFLIPSSCLLVPKKLDLLLVKNYRFFLHLRYPINYDKLVNGHLLVFLNNMYAFVIYVNVFAKTLVFFQNMWIPKYRMKFVLSY